MVKEWRTDDPGAFRKTTARLWRGEVYGETYLGDLRLEHCGDGEEWKVYHRGGGDETRLDTIRPAAFGSLTLLREYLRRLDALDDPADLDLAADLQFEVGVLARSGSEESADPFSPPEG